MVNDMALGLQTESGGGDYKPVAKYDARAGRFFRVDRTQDSAGNWQTNNVEITNGFQAVFDLENIEVGWMLFAAGVAPMWSMVKLGEQLPAKPSDTHKQGFRMAIKLGKSIGGDVREFASQAKAVIAAVDALHTVYTAEKGAHPGQLPVVAMTGATAVVSSGKGQSSTNYAPVFEIVAWVDRPPEFDGATSAAAPATQAAPTAQAAAQPAPAKELASVGSEF
jgi:hypothetical protein